MYIYTHHRCIHTCIYIYCMLGEHLEGLVQLVLSNHLEKGDTVSCIVGKHIRTRVVFRSPWRPFAAPHRPTVPNVSFQEIFVSGCVSRVVFCPCRHVSRPVLLLHSLLKQNHGVVRNGQIQEAGLV